MTIYDIRVLPGGRNAALVIETALLRADHVCGTRCAHGSICARPLISTDRDALIVSGCAPSGERYQWHRE